MRKETDKVMQKFRVKNVIVSVVLLLLLLFTVDSCGRGEGEGEGVVALVVHGGAGTILKEKMTPELEAAYRETLAEALREGYAVLDEGGPSLDAVVVAIRVLEDSELFNAGKGAVFTAEGKNELDASIMDGATGMAGAVGSVTTIKNPIVAARAVMERTRHVMLVGRGAEMFAAEQDILLYDAAQQMGFDEDGSWEFVDYIQIIYTVTSPRGLFRGRGR